MKTVPAFAGEENMIEKLHLFEIEHRIPKMQSVPTLHCVPLQASELL